MSAPRSVEFEKDILFALHDDVLVVLRYNNGDWTILLLWDWLALNACLDLARDEVFDEFANLLLA